MVPRFSDTRTSYLCSVENTIVDFCRMTLTNPTLNEGNPVQLFRLEQGVALLPHPDLSFDLLWPKSCPELTEMLGARMPPLAVAAALSNSCDGDPAVVMWVKHGNQSKSVLQLLVEYGADVNAQDSCLGSTALCWAVLILY